MSDNMPPRDRGPQSDKFRCMDELSSASNFDRAPLSKFGGARRDRTDDLLLAKQALSQLSYGPDVETPNTRSSEFF